MSSANQAASQPRLTLVLRDIGDEIMPAATLPSLGQGHQQGVEAEAYEVIVVGFRSEPPVWWPAASIGVRLRWLDVAEPSAWTACGAENAEGELVCFVEVPAVATPTLIASLLLALDAHDAPRVSIAFFRLARGWDGDVRKWLEANQWPKDPFALMAAANPEPEWLDPLRQPLGIALLRDEARRVLSLATGLTLAELLERAGGTRVQLLGDAFVRPDEPSSAPKRAGASIDQRPVDQRVRR